MDNLLLLFFHNKNLYVHLLCWLVWYVHYIRRVSVYEWMNGFLQQRSVDRANVTQGFRCPKFYLSQFASNQQPISLEAHTLPDEL